jgi:integrase
MLATLTFAGLRIGELLSLRWRDVDLAGGWLTVGEAKTDAGRRKVKIRGALRDELLSLRAERKIDQNAYVFPTRTGVRLGPDNFRNRVLAAAVRRADKRLAEQAHPPLPKLTPHSLRRTFCSLLYALGESPPVVMQEMGHTDPKLALRVYAQAMRRDEHQQAELRALVEGTPDGRLGERLGERGAEAAPEGVTAALESADLQA